MAKQLRWALFALAMCAAAVATAGRARAGTLPVTILEMTLGDPTSDVRFDGTNFYTIDDNNPANAGPQNTGILFSNFIDSYGPDIPTPIASFSMTGLQKTGQAVLVGGTNLIVQQFNGGNFVLKDDSSNILLQGTLALSALNGALGNSTGGLFTTSIVNVTGGALQNYIAPGSLHFSMNFTAIQQGNGNTGLGLSLLPPSVPSATNFSADLLPFTADATVNADAVVPEPAGMVLLVICGWLAAGFYRRNR